MARRTRIEEIRRVFRVTLAVLAIVAIMTFVVSNILYSLVILAVASPSLLSLSFSLRRLERRTPGKPRRHPYYSIIVEVNGVVRNTPFSNCSSSSAL